ncbi:MAG: hypothetical protein EPO24_07785 [Bacteroidetes bacterium]|nr:MAG: hypothetical protein EPO24_07785 [Bacteroidota bacterium]
MKFRTIEPEAHQPFAEIRVIVVVTVIVMGVMLIGCGGTITKDTLIQEVTDTVYVPGKSIAIETASDSITYDVAQEESNEPGAMSIEHRSLSYEEKVEKMREASERAAKRADLLLKGDTPSILPLKKQGETRLKGFTAMVETTLQGVRIRLQYQSPADWWKISFIEGDTFATKSRMDTSKTTIIERPIPYVPFWCYLTLVVIGGLLVFIGLPKLKSLVGL